MASTGSRSAFVIVGSALFLLVVLVLALLSPSARAATAGGCGTTLDDFGRVIARACASGTAPAATDATPGAATTSTPARTCAYGTITVPCTTAAGNWSGGCYLEPADPQPPVGDPSWLGNTDGLILACTPYPCLGTTGATIPDCPTIARYWAAAPPDDAAVVVDEATAARRAIAQLDLDPITITMAPPPNLADPNVLIGAPAFFWAEGGAAAIGPLTTTVTQDGLTIALSASLEAVEFDTGDGSSTTCTRDQVAAAPTHMDFDVVPECGHVWLHPGRLTLTATSTWTITWQGPTQNGTLDHTLTSAIDVAITDRPVNLTTNK